MLTAPSGRLNEPEERYIAAVCAASPALARMHVLAQEFCRITIDRLLPITTIRAEPISRRH